MYPTNQPILNSNKVFNFIYNMILSQRVFVDNISNTQSTLVDKSRVQGGLYGDSLWYYSTDAAKSFEWTGDAEAENLLKLHRPIGPKAQKIDIDTYRMIPMTVDQFLSKNAFSTEGAFTRFNSQLLAWMRDTKKIYDATIFNSFIGTHEKNEGRQMVTFALPAEPDAADEVNTEAYNRLKAQTIATNMADLMVDLEDFSRDFNTFGQLRSENLNDLVFVWNADVVNEIRKLDLPTIFHKDGLVDKFAEYVLPARYFGSVNTVGGTTSATNLTVRSLIEKDYNTKVVDGKTVVMDQSDPSYDPKKHIFAGELLPANTAYEAYETYGEDPSVICKIYHKDSVPFATGFETGSEFWNPRALTQTHYLIWSYNTLESLDNLPFITVKTV